MRTIFVLLSITFLSACASIHKASQPDVNKKAVVSENFDKTWSNVIKFFSERGIPIKTIDKNSGLIATDEMAFNSDSEFFVCDKFGYTNNSGIPIKGLGSFNVFVTKVDNKSTSLQVNLFGRATAINPGAPPYVPPSIVDLSCYSTGQMERNLFNQVQRSPASQAMK